MIRHSVVALALSLFAAGVAEARVVELKTGIRVQYDEAGPESAPTLILLHGLGDTKRSWSLVTRQLAKTYRVYALDQRGHGASSKPACCYAVADLAYDVITFMDAMKIERAAIAGHSMGSFVAQHLAAHYPDRVAKLILIGSSDTAVGVPVLSWLWDQVPIFDRGISASFIDEWQWSPTPVDENFILEVKEETAQVPPHVWKSVARTLMTDDQRVFLKDIKAPTLILWGVHDPAFPLPNQERLQRSIPHAKFVAYPTAGHNLHWEIPGRAAKDMLTFLTGTWCPES